MTIKKKKKVAIGILMLYFESVGVEYFMNNWFEGKILFMNG